MISQNLRVICQVWVFRPKQYSTLDDPSKCPVAAYTSQAFRDHRPASTMTLDSPFYVAINHKRLQGSSIWYENQPLGENTLDEDKSFNTINYMHQLASCPYCNSTINWSQKRLNYAVAKKNEINLIKQRYCSKRIETCCMSSPDLPHNSDETDLIKFIISPINISTELFAKARMMNGTITINNSDEKPQKSRKRGRVIYSDGSEVGRV